MSEGKTKQRTIEYDLARVLAIVGVIAIHCVAFVVILDFKPMSKTWHMANLVDAFSHWCVPVFIMLSGALLIKPGFDMNKLKSFYSAKVSRIVIPFVIWSIIYLAWYAIMISHDNLRSDLQFGLVSLLTGWPVGAHLYFILIIIGLYAITPFLSVMVGQVNQKIVAGLSVGVLLAATVSLTINTWLTHRSGTNFVTMFLPYTGYYILGYVINVNRHHLKSMFSGRQIAALFTLIGLLIAGATYCLTLPTSHLNTYFYDYLSPLTILLSLSAIIGLMKLSDYIASKKVAERWFKVDYASTIVKLSNMTFGVYFVHLLLINVFWLVFKEFRYGSNNDFMVAVVTFVVIVPASFILTHLYGKAVHQITPIINYYRNLLSNKLYAVEDRLKPAEAGADFID